MVPSLRKPTAHSSETSESKLNPRMLGTAGEDRKQGRNAQRDDDRQQPSLGPGREARAEHEVKNAKCEDCLGWTAATFHALSELRTHEVVPASESALPVRLP